MAFKEQISYQLYTSSTGTTFVISDFYFTDTEYIVVNVYEADGTKTLMVKDVDWSITGKTITRLTTWPAGQVLVNRENDYNQETSYRNAEIGFDREQLETGLDYITMLSQQNKDIFVKSIRTPLFDPATNMELPTVANRLGKFITFDAQGNIIVRQLNSADLGAATIAWQATFTEYAIGWLVEYDGALWVGVNPVTGSAPSNTSGEWNLLVRDLKQNALWQADVEYDQNDITNYGGAYYICTAVLSTVGVAPVVGSGDWKLWTSATSETVAVNSSITDGRPNHTTFVDTTLGSIDITINDGYLTGDKVTIAAYGGNNVNVTAEGVVQVLSNTAAIYLWTGTSFIAISSSGGGGGGGIALGEVTWWPGPTTVTIPEGKLVADGSIILIADYPNLFAKLGTTWGGDGTLNFGLPNIQGLFPGAIGTQGTHGDGGNAVGDLVEDSIKSSDLTASFSGTALGTHGHVQGINANPVANTHYGDVTVNNAKQGVTLNQGGMVGAPNTSSISAGTPAGSVTIADTGATETRPASVMGQWLIQAAAPVPTEINATVVDVMIGDVRWNPHTVLDSNDLVCDGSVVLINDYPELYVKLGIAWGGDGVADFALPDLRSAYPGMAGTNGVLSNANGGTLGDYLADRYKNHIHTMPTHRHNDGHSTAHSANSIYGNRTLSTKGSVASNNATSTSYPYTSTDDPGDANISTTGGVDTMPATLIGQWVIRAKNPTVYVIKDQAQLITDILDLLHPVGDTVMQMPGTQSPADKGWPGTWINDSASFAGEFFRVEGGNASGFESGTQAEEFKEHTHIQDSHTHTITGTSSAGGSSNAVMMNGDNIGNKSWTSNGRTATNQDSGGVETRPINKTIRIWKRTA